MIDVENLAEYPGAEEIAVENSVGEQTAVVETVDPDVIAQAVLYALDQRDVQAELMAGEEIMIPEMIEDIAVIKSFVQNILDFFQEDDHDVLTDVRDDVSGIREYLESQASTGSDSHLMMTTNFADYTVTEGLLLLIFLSIFIRSLISMIRSGFSWLA